MSRSLIPNSTQIPDILLDFWMAALSPAEFKVLMYVARRTYGFGKKEDNISLRQLVVGMKAREIDEETGEKKIHNTGTGMSKDSVARALQGLEGKGIVERIRNQSDEHGHQSNTYRLNLNADLPPPEDDEGPLSENRTSSTAKSVIPLVRESDKHGGNVRQAPVLEPDKPLSESRTHKKQDQQETREQETTTQARDREADVAVASSPSAEGEAERLLTEAGFSASVARSLAHHGAETVRRQIEALPKRKVGKNRLGMLRKAIEEGWEIPQTPQEARAKDERIETKAHQERQEARERAQTERARETLAQLRTAAPEAFSAFLEFVGEKKRRALAGDIGKRSSKAQLALEQIYDSEEKQFELLPEFLAKHPQGRELSPFLAAAA